MSGYGYGYDYMGGGGGYSYPKNYDHVLDYLTFHDDTLFTDDLFDDDDCEFFVSHEEYKYSSFDFAIPIDGLTSNPGTRYIWSDQNILMLDGSIIKDTIITGTCTRTGHGAGTCNMVIKDDTGEQLTFSGRLDSSLSGGKFAITGGTGSLTGIVGEMHVKAYTEGAGDVFDDATHYEVAVTLGIIVSPSQPVPHH